MCLFICLNHVLVVACRIFSWDKQDILVVAMWDWTGSPALGARSLSHCTTRKVPQINNLNIIRTFSKTMMVRLIDDSTYTFAFGLIPKYHFIGLNGYLPPEVLNSTTIIFCYDSGIHEFIIWIHSWAIYVFRLFHL